MKVWWRRHRLPLFDIALWFGLALAAFWVVSLLVEKRPMDANLPAEPDGCPLAANLPAGYALLGRGVFTVDERRAYPRTMSIYTAPDGSWLIGHDPIGTGEYLCTADQGVKFTLETTGARR